MQPTSEQRDALDLFEAGLKLAIEAGAGTGKTTTLQMLARSTSRLGCYLAFNRAIVDEAGRKMPRNVKAFTAHSLAMRSVGRQYGHRLDSGRMRSTELARLLGVDAFVVRYGAQTKVLQPSFLASLVMRTITNYCFSDEELPGRHHVPYVPGVDVPDSRGGQTWVNNDAIRDHIGDVVQRAWADICDVNGRLPFTHDHYLKMYERSNPVIPADFVMLDEAQDASPVMMSIMAQQTNSQLVYVGDSCQPTGTLVRRIAQRGSGRRASVIEDVPIEQIRVDDHVLSYSVERRHWHRRGRRVTGVSEREFYGDLVAVKSERSLSRYTPDHHCIVRMGAAFDDKHVVYLMRRGHSYRVGRAAGTYATQYRASGPMLRAVAEQAHALWILSVHDTAEEAATAEALVSHRFGLPMMLFRAANNRLMSQAGIDRFWLATGDLTSNANGALVAHGRDVKFPLWQAAEQRLLMRRSTVIRACNLVDGMLMLSDEQQSDASEGWHAIVVHRESYAGSVYSMRVEGDHTYVGDGILTHNCQQIYGWRGAVNALQSVPFDARSFLTQSFRFGPEIAAVANVILEELDAELRITGLSSIDSHVRPIQTPRCILTRSNAVAVTNVLQLLREGRRVYLLGGGVEVVRFARAAIELQETGGTNYPDLACFVSWAEVVEYVQQDPQGDELALLVSLIEEFGAQTIIDGLDATAPEALAEITISTAHKAKGREWESVQLAEDFHDVEAAANPEEWRLMYVAATRAQVTLDIMRCVPIRKVTDPGYAQRLASASRAVQPS